MGWCHGLVRRASGTGLVGWAGVLGWRAGGLGSWSGLVVWAGGLGWWPGLVGWAGWLGWWPGLAAWAGGLGGAGKHIQRLQNFNLS